MGKVFSREPPLPDRRVIMTGVIGAGKTTLLHNLQAGEVVDEIPTIGFTIETLRFLHEPSGLQIGVKALPMGGCDKISALYKCYGNSVNSEEDLQPVRTTHATAAGDKTLLICVVRDERPAIHDETTWTYQRAELDRYFLQNGNAFEGCPILFVLNTQEVLYPDQPHGATEEDVVRGMRLEELTAERPWTLVSCVAKRDGVANRMSILESQAVLLEGITWLLGESGFPPDRHHSVLPKPTKAAKPPASPAQEEKMTTSTREPPLSSPPPPYVCCILLRARDDHLLLEQRGPDARVAKGKRTCFGGKREAGETPEEAMHRELREELGGVWMPSPAPERACDLYVDGQLIAYFYTASAPDDAAAATLTYETGRRGAWMPRDIAATDPAVSPWHRCVLQAWLRGERRADFDSSGDEAGKREEGDGDGGAGTTGAEEAALSNGGAAEEGVVAEAVAGGAEGGAIEVAVVVAVDNNADDIDDNGSVESQYLQVCPDCDTTLCIDTYIMSYASEAQWANHDDTTFCSDCYWENGHYKDDRWEDNVDEVTEGVANRGIDPREVFLLRAPEPPRKPTKAAKPAAANVYADVGKEGGEREGMEGGAP